MKMYLTKLMYIVYTQFFFRVAYIDFKNNKCTGNIHKYSFYISSFNFNTQEELHTQKRMQFDKVLITMGITLESSKIKISIVIALALFHLTL